MFSQDAWALETTDEYMLDMEMENEMENFTDQTGDVNGVTQKYGTMDIVIFQTFFDKFSRDFIPGLLNGLENVMLKPINGTIHLLDDELSF